MATLFVYNTNRNEYQLTIATAKLQTAVKWLRSINAKFFTVSDRFTKTTVIRFAKNGIEQQWAAALSRKHGRKDANAPKTAATSPRVRKQFVAPVETAPVAEVAPVAEAIHTASQLPEPAMPNAITETIGNTPIYLGSYCATKAELLALTKKALKKFASQHNVKGRTKMEPVQLAEALLGLVKKSDIAK